MNGIASFEKSALITISMHSFWPTLKLHLRLARSAAAKVKR